jgi:hypothetical protein
MAYKTVPFNVVGGSHSKQSRPLSSQRTINLYPDYDEAGKDNFVLHSWAGQKLIGEVTGLLDRGMHRMNEVLYRVIDNTLYSVNKYGTHTSIGTIPNTDRCIFTDDGDNLVIVTGGSVYIYTKSANTLQQNTNSNLNSVISADIINYQVLYTTKDLTFVADAGDPFSVNGLNAIGAESNPDEMVRDFQFNQTIYRFGKRTTELWYNSGVGSPPIDRIEGAMFSVGLLAKHSLARTDSAIYWLGDDFNVYRTQSRQEERLSDDSLAYQIQNMSVIDDAIGYTVTINDNDFYILAFPSENVTFAVNEKLGKAGWFELADELDTAYNATSAITAYNKQLVASGGKLLHLTTLAYDNNGKQMPKQRITSSASGRMFQLGNKRLKMLRAEFLCDVGNGLINGQGSDPRMLVEYSIDGGRTFAHGAWLELGRLGEYTKRVEFWKKISFNDLIFKLTVNDSVQFSLYNATIDVKSAGSRR